jgi:hypothetical protein
VSIAIRQKHLPTADWSDLVKLKQNEKKGEEREMQIKEKVGNKWSARM